jgi:hypothetical protein
MHFYKLTGESTKFMSKSDTVITLSKPVSSIGSTWVAGQLLKQIN